MLKAIPEADEDTLRRSLGDIVALSTLTAVWAGAKPVRIAESLGAALYSMLGAKLVYVALDDPKGGALARIAQTGRYLSDERIAGDLGPKLVDWARRRDPHELYVHEVPGEVPLRITCRQLGHNAELGVIAAGFAGDDAPAPLHHLLLDVSATQATTGLNNALAVQSLRQSEARLQDQTVALEALNRTAAATAGEKDLDRVVQTVTDAGVELSGAEFGAFFYNVIDRSGESYMLYALSGAPMEAFAGFPMPRNTAIFAPTFSGEGVIRSDDIKKDPRYGKNAPRSGMPQGHLPVSSYLAAPVVSRTGEVLGGLFFGHSATGRFTEEHERRMVGLAAQAAIAIDNARLFQAVKASNESLEERVAEALAERKVFSDVIDSSTTAVTALGLNFEILAINRANIDAFEQVYGKRPRVGDQFLDLFADMPEHVTQQRDIWQRALNGEEFFVIQAFGDDRFERRYYEVRFSTLRDSDGRMIGASSTSYDVTDKVLAEQRLEVAQEQLRQAQKMEAVGQLTGGIAHDFNNMLAVVSGSLDLLERRTPVDDGRARRLISSAQEASRRAANLTRRLLAFSRQQPLEPEVLDINKLVSGMSDLFRHSLGADVQLETVLAGGIWPAFVDQNQLESILLNLAVNARDAMPGGGHLTIETQNTHLDARYVAEEPGVVPGQYVMLAVTDTGTGMPPEVIAKAFDPFFTTKEVGKGTGLGLSQVYGFIKQSGGHIKIYSEVGQGTTIKLYLPRHIGPAVPMESRDHEARLPAAESRELILVVDDEEIVRNVSIEALTELGYGVLSAGGAAEALAIIGERTDIDLLFTDIVMPEVNGRKLADAVQALRPELPILYTTGYTRNAVVHNGVLDAGVDLIGKPFTLDELALKVREVLDTALLRRKVQP